MTIQIFDGKKTVTLTGDEGWQVYGASESPENADRLYSLVSWLYRCVTVRGNSVSSMPFVVRRGEDEVYQFDGATAQYDPPADIEWIQDLPTMLGKVEIATTLGGRAYFERRPNVLGTRSIGFDWLLPWSIEPIFNNVSNRFGTEVDTSKPYGDLLGFWRHFLDLTPRPIRFDPEELVYFWPPDYAVEIGPAINYPARAILANAKVIGNMDLFLAGYFDRGMIKATLLKYKDMISADEAKRVKEWWRRVFTGIANAFATEVVRGDFEVMPIGEGIKDLRDNVLTQDEKKDIAIGMGIPLSKVDSTASTDANREADDRQYLEDTIIPEVNWIYRTVNRQILEPMGYRLVAQPQQLRVMQTDENQRAGAFASYVGAGMSIEAAVAVLGIHVPDDVNLKDDAPEMEEAAVGDMEDEVEDSAAKDLPDDIDEMPGDTMRAIDFIALLDKRDERERFKRWLGNRTNYDVTQYKTDLLTDHEKAHIAIDYIRANEDGTAQKALNDRIDDYVEELSGLVLDLVDSNLTRDDMILRMQDAVRERITAEFRNGADIPEGEPLSSQELQGLSDVLSINLQAIPGFVDAALAEFQKGVLLDSIKDRAATIGNRLGLWGNALRESLNLGRIFNRDREAKFEWRLGATEEHCTDCLRQHRQIRTSAEWQQLASVLIYPQSRALECKGYNCDCALYRVN